MTGRLLRIVLSALLIPALTGIGTSCAPMEQAGPAGSYAAGVASHCDTSSTTGQSGGAHKQHSRQHHNPSATNCCPAIAGCSAVALPALVAFVRPATPIVASTHLAYAGSPIALAVAPEPPPPKA